MAAAASGIFSRQFYTVEESGIALSLGKNNEIMLLLSRFKYVKEELAEYYIFWLESEPKS